MGSYGSVPSESSGVIIYEHTMEDDSKIYVGTYWWGLSTFSGAPQAVMGQANTYTSGVPIPAESATLEEAIAKLAHIGGPSAAKKDGRYYYITWMGVTYRFTGDY
jgi:hypothetical protein